MNPWLPAFLGIGIALLGRPRTRAGTRRRLSGIAAKGAPPSATRPRARGVPPAVLPIAAAAGVAVIAITLQGSRGLLAALAGGPIVAMGVRRSAARAHSVDRDAQQALPLLLDLIAAALRTGAPTSVAVGAVTGAAPPSVRASLTRTAALLRLGAAPAEAWSPVQSHPVLGAVAAVATRSADSGIRLADGLERHAGEMRAELRTAGVARAQRVATIALLPLGLCFLPAFVCLGVVPIVIGVAGNAFSSVAP